MRRITFDTYEATLVKKIHFTQDVWILTFELDKEIDFNPGQYVSFYLPGMKPAPFSIASAPSSKEIMIGLEVVGPVTKALSELKDDDVVTIKGPFGNFTMGNEKQICLLAGGIGLTPFMSMMRWVRDTNAEKEIVLFYSCRHPKDFLWKGELDAMPENIRVVYTCTREEPQGWEHHIGRIDGALIEKELADVSQYTFYTCGPKDMIDTMFSLLEAKGVEKDRLRREVWG